MCGGPTNTYCRPATHRATVKQSISEHNLFYFRRTIHGITVITFNRDGLRPVSIFKHSNNCEWTTPKLSTTEKHRFKFQQHSWGECPTWHLVALDVTELWCADKPHSRHSAQAHTISLSFFSMWAGTKWYWFVTIQFWHLWKLWETNTPKNVARKR